MLAHLLPLSLKVYAEDHVVQACDRERGGLQRTAHPLLPGDDGCLVRNGWLRELDLEFRDADDGLRLDLRSDSEFRWRRSSQYDHEVNARSYAGHRSRLAVRR